jgi:hypothetical protein
VALQSLCQAFYPGAAKASNSAGYRELDRVRRGGDGSGIDCLVRNMSDGGANLEVESQVGIPSSFELVINVEHSNHHCHV